MSGATSPFCAAIERLASAKGRGRLGTRRLAEGQLMCAADDPDLEDDGLLVVRSGRLRCFTSFEGKELTLFTLDPNDVVFVEAGFMLEARRDCTFWVMSLSAFREAALDEPLLALSAVDVFEPGLVPADYMKDPPPPPPEIDRKLVMQALKEGFDVPGCRLTQGERVEIK